MACPSEPTATRARCRAASGCAYSSRGVAASRTRTSAAALALLAAALRRLTAVQASAHADQ
jgi:hypothetical protein